MDNSIIDLSLKNIWQSWFKFRKGKQYTSKMHEFQYNLEENLYKLYLNLNNGIYKHSLYSKFFVTDNKKREISVCEIKDRILHRLVYDYLCKIYDKTFIYDAWSCRKGKGLLGAIERTQKFLKNQPHIYIWKADIKKFFDNVDHNILRELLKFRIKNKKVLKILGRIISSFDSRNKPGKGIPIGNLTSQIFSNIYLNELDRFVKHRLGIKKYLRYGDDFVVIHNDLFRLQELRLEISTFLSDSLYLQINKSRDFIMKTKQGLQFLGVVIFPNSRKLNKRNKKRILKRVDLKNIGSYYGIIKQHGDKKFINLFNYKIVKLLI